MPQLNMAYDTVFGFMLGAAEKDYFWDCLPEYWVAESLQLTYATVFLKKDSKTNLHRRLPTTSGRF